MLIGTITAAYLCGSTFFVHVTSPSGQLAIYTMPWSTAQTNGIPGVLQAIETAGVAWSQPIPSWVQQMIGQIVTFG